MTKIACAAFEQEARAASALNHPNIITIYEIGEADGAHFIATEFIDGETLRQHMAQRALQIDEALDIALQVAARSTPRTPQGSCIATSSPRTS